MKSLRTFSLLVPVPLVFCILALYTPATPLLAQNAVDADYTDSYLVLNYNLESSPPTLDPAMTNDTASSKVIEQLFIGLVGIDEETGVIEPELALDWTLSQDELVYTFTLRENAHWSDGSLLTAEDVRYSLLRVLNPATGSQRASLLFFIKNGEEFNNGSIQDPDLVGVSAPSPYVLRIELTAPSTKVMDKLAQPQARPVPQRAIEEHGENWTAPENIVVSGAYDLATEATDHLTLLKNDDFFAAADVQIERVNMWFVNDASVAWQMYVDGELDIASVPNDAIPTAMQTQQIELYTSLCTYYYGFNISLPPFDNALVRKAFASAASRVHLTTSRRGSTPAITYIPPGIPGYANGYEEGIGLPFNPYQARTWLAEAGYPNGVGLPEVELWFNSGPGNESIAEFIGQSWEEELGATVNLNSAEWSDFIAAVDRGDYPVWRMGWCADYPDGLNFLRDGIVSRAAHGNWMNPEYEALLTRIEAESDPAQQQQDYNRAQEILVESDAVIMPIYFYGGRMAIKPYLQSSNPRYSSPNFAKWRLDIAQESIPIDGGEVTTSDQEMTATAPQGTFTDTVNLRIRTANAIPDSPELLSINRNYDLNAYDPANGDSVELAEDGVIELTANFLSGEYPVKEETLALYYWDEDNWVKEPSSVVDLAAGTVAAAPNHLSTWAIFGETERLFLPFIAFR